MTWVILRRSDSEKSSQEIVDEFINWVNNFCTTNNLPDIKHSATDEWILNLSYIDLMELSSEECYANAFCLMNYASFLQKKSDEIRGHLAWCNTAMDYLFSQKWDHYAGKFTPKEIIKQSIIRDVPDAQVLEKCRLRLGSVYHISAEQCKDVKTRVDLLQSLGKKRSFS